MNLQKYFQSAVVLASMLLLSCANTGQKSKEAEKQVINSSAEANAQGISNSAAWDASAHNFVEISFDKGSHALSKNAKANLNAILGRADQFAKIDQVIVLAWGDEEYPSKKRNKLSKKQISLAEDRNRSVKTYVGEITNAGVDSYNMAERPTAFSKWFNTADNQLKDSLLAAGLPTTAKETQITNKASHAVILIKVK